MAIITTGSHPKALWPGIYAWWGRSYDQHAVEYADLYDIDTSDKAYEETVGISGFGLAPVKDQGASIDYDTETQGYITRFTNVAYALGYIVTYEELKDDLYEQVSKRRVTQLSFSMRQTQENIGALPYNRAFSDTFPIGDGKALISASHPTLSGNQSNILANPADLSETAIEDLLIQIALFTNDRGLRINAMPQSLHIHWNNFFEAHRILDSVLQNDTAQNAVNVLKMTGAFPNGIKANHYFTSPTAWFVRTNVPYGMMWFDREKASFAQDNDFDTKNAKAASYMRFSCGGNDWRGIAGSAGV